jgi:hypothetical protein
VAVLFAGALVQEPTIVIGFTGAVAVAAGFARGRWVPLLALGIGVLVGIELLSKLSTGITLAGLGVVALLAMPAPRRLATGAFAVGVLGALVLGWFATGQSLGAVDDYVTGSLEIVSGYSEAMYFEDPTTGWEFWAAFLVIGIGYAVVWRAAELLSRRTRLGLFALWTVLAFTTFKAGFVRHDQGHVNIFFASMLGGLVAFGWVPHRRSTVWLIGLLVTTMLFASLRTDPANLIDPIARTDRLFDQARLLADGTLTNAKIAEARVGRLPLEQLDPELHKEVRGGTVHIEPVESGMAWAQRLRWRPLPVFQTYSAYTQELDERNAAAIRGPRAPDRILRENGVYLDRGNPIRSAAIDAPATYREMLCHYRAGTVIAPWIVLERSAPRCGRPRPLMETTATLGKAAPIPPAPDQDSVVFMRIDGIGVSGIEHLRSALYRALPRAIAFDGGRTFRLLPGTAGDGLVVRVPPEADLPAPYALDQASETVTITRALDRDTVRLRFYSMSIR